MKQGADVRRMSQVRHLKREVEELSWRIREMERAEKMGNACIAGMPEACGREHLPGAGRKIAWMRALLSERRMACLEELAQPTLGEGESAASLLEGEGDLGMEIAEESERLGARGYGHVRLNQLALEHLIG